MKRLTALILIILFATTITACGGASEAAESATVTPLPTIPPTADIPTPDTSVDIQSDNNNADTDDSAQEMLATADLERGREIFFEGGAEEAYTAEFA